MGDAEVAVAAEPLLLSEPFVSEAVSLVASMQDHVMQAVYGDTGSRQLLEKMYMQVRGCRRGLLLPAAACYRLPLPAAGDQPPSKPPALALALAPPYPALPRPVDAPCHLSLGGEPPPGLLRWQHPWWVSLPWGGCRGGPHGLPPRHAVI